METAKEKKLFILFSLIQACIVIGAFVGGFFARGWLMPWSDQFPVFFQAYDIIQKKGLKILPDLKTIEYGMIRGMLQAYDDPHTSFLEPPQHELQSDRLSGKFGGIGCRLERDAENNLLLYPFKDSPAENAGVLEGDRLMSVGELSVKAETSIDEILAAVRGPVGESVGLVVARPPDYKTISLSVERQEIAIPSITWNLVATDQRVGMVQINIIAATTPKEMQDAIQDLKKRGATHFILDFRNNGGGLVDGGVETAKLFLEDGEVIEQQYRDQAPKSYKVERPGIFVDLPIVVLVNKNTASAAEIIAGSLQAHHRGALIGQPTYGKDSIQLVYELTDKSSLHITAAKWWVPGLKIPLGGIGLQPDFMLPEEETTDAKLIKIAIEQLFKEKPAQENQQK